MKKLFAVILTALIITAFASGCSGKTEDKLNAYVRENQAFSTMIGTMKATYGDVMDIQAYGRDGDLVIELKAVSKLPAASLKGIENETDFKGLSESLSRYLPGIRAESEQANIIYIVKDADGTEIVNKTIS